ncbi:hypothetical protein BX600DRAFT_466788 [Xylariales sp. PMI_506]|nr:hypothetical protein BX600DRAFT_466788 [Xylariales sp. PMI_506]
MDLIPTMAFDAITTMYLTILFLRPLLGTYSIRRSFATTCRTDSIAPIIHAPPPNPKLKALVIKTIIGSTATTIVSIVNVALVFTLHGEEAWICLLSCTSDVVFSAVVIDWVTYA